MLQVENLSQTKSIPFLEHFCILKSILVREITVTWNHFLPDLLLIHEKLVARGFVYSEGEIMVIEPREDRDI